MQASRHNQDKDDALSSHGKWDGKKIQQDFVNMLGTLPEDRKERLGSECVHINAYVLRSYP